MKRAIEKGDKCNGKYVNLIGCEVYRKIKADNLSIERGVKEVLIKDLGTVELKIYAFGR